MYNNQWWNVTNFNVLEDSTWSYFTFHYFKRLLHYSKDTDNQKKKCLTSARIIIQANHRSNPSRDVIKSFMVDPGSV